ncbi:Conserved_hypothetical protein [Hexamita inflata]|uniref:Signal recognition particle receptor subunit beta n=1 Tax=Hexamita inflata TaxID=28002 RepID=A0AA86P311_9EUKA|nr:Conserved hypothetical protein [Hexamita inflata]
MKLVFLQTIFVTIAILIIVRLKKHSFIPRLSIIGPHGVGKTRFYYAIRDHRIVRTTKSMQSNVFKGYLQLTNGEAELIDFSAEPRLWPEESQYKLMNSMVILFVTSESTQEESLALIQNKILWKARKGLTYVIQGQYKEGFKAKLNALGIDAEDNQFVTADLGLQTWNVIDLAQLLRSRL